MHIRILLVLLLFLYFISGTVAKKSGKNSEKLKGEKHLSIKEKHLSIKGKKKDTDKNGKHKSKARKRKKIKLEDLDVKLDINVTGQPYRGIDEHVYRADKEVFRDKFDRRQAEKSKRNKREREAAKIKHGTPPNIIFILADDLGFNDVGWHALGGSQIRTPFLNNLAYSGVRLENFYVQPVCSPTRSQLMTGRYSTHMGIQHVNFSPRDGLCLPLNEKLLPGQLREFGYATHAVGKWHLGMSRPGCLPTRRGFDSFLGILLGTSDHFNYRRVYRSNGKKTSGLALYENETATDRYAGQFCTFTYTKRAQHIIRNHDQTKPLFLYIAFQMVHNPPQVPPQYMAKFKRIRSSRRRTYAGQVYIMDEAVRNITATLRRQGMLANSVIIFSSDNGGKPSDEANNWPLRGGKGALWEGGIRSPTLVYSPLFPKDIRGTVNWELMHVSDWLPTLVEGVAGGNLSTMPNPLDGFNVWKSIRSGKKSPRKVLLHNIDPTCRRHSWGVTDREQWGDLSKLPFNVTIRAAIRVGDWKLITGKAREGLIFLPYESRTRQPKDTTKLSRSSAIRLYDIRGDPSEKYNLAPHYPDKVRAMLKRLKKYHKSSKHPVKIREDKRCNPKRYGGVWKPWLTDDNEPR